MGVAALARFYQAVTGIAPVGSEEYVELRSAGATLSISNTSAVKLCGGGAAVPSMNRSMILDFEVDDVDAERVRLAGVVVEWVLEPTTQPWGTVRCCSGTGRQPGQSLCEGSRP